jgi:hypothetical protein
VRGAMASQMLHLIHSANGSELAGLAHYFLGIVGSH